jgi:hypothetical protein
MVDFHCVIPFPSDLDVASDNVVDVEVTTEDEVSVTPLISSALQELNTTQNKINSIKPGLIHFFIFQHSYCLFVASNEHQQTNVITGIPWIFT